MKTILQKIASIAILVSLLCSLLPTKVNAVVKPIVYSVNFLNAKSAEQHTLSLLSFYGNTYISVEDAAKVSGMNYRTNSGKHYYEAGYHQVEYVGEEMEYNNHIFLDMKYALDQLSCVYVYSEEIHSVIFNPQTSFVENLYADCVEILTGTANYDLQWIADIPGIEIGALYDIFSGFKIKALWGGDKRERYENVLKGIMLPSENESALLSLASEGNSLLGDLSEIVEFEKEFLNNNIVGELFGPTAQSIYETLHTIDGTIPGLSFGDCYEIIGNAYGAKNSASLYINAVQYGLYNNKKIDDKQLRIATDNVYRAFDNERSKWNNIFLDTTISALENATEKLIEEVVGSVLSCNQFVVKIFTSLVDNRLGIDKKVGATLALLDCATIQKETLEQYYAANDPLQMKYCMVLYLRSCWYGYTQFAKTGSTGKWSCQVMEPLIDDAMLKLASYSDDELTREVDNEILSLETLELNVVDEMNFNGYLVDKLGMHKDDVITTLGEPNEVVMTDVWTISYGNGTVQMDYTDEQTLSVEGLPYNRIYQIRLPSSASSNDNIHSISIAPGITTDITMDGIDEAEQVYGYVSELISDDGGTGNMIININSDKWKIQLLWIAGNSVINPVSTPPNSVTLIWTDYESSITPGKNEIDNADETELVNFLGKHIDEVVEEYGIDYVADYWNGGCYLAFNGVPAMFFYDVESGEVFLIKAAGNLRIIGRITADLNYTELNSLVPMDIPHEFYSEMDSVAGYTASIQYDDYVISFEWHGDPYHTVPYDVSVSLADAQDEYYDNWSEKGTTNIISEPSQTGVESIKFDEIPSEFVFTSGAGAWSTRITISSDGSFVGTYHDTDAGDAGINYPNGTVYYSNFTGKFSAPFKVNDYMYKMILQAFTLSNVKETETVENGVRRIASRPAGFDDATEYYLYLPGIPHTMMPTDCYTWVSQLLGDNKINRYVLCSSNGVSPFVAE